MTRVYLRHARQIPGYRQVLCATGIRAWCKTHGLDMSTLSRDGYPADTIAAIDDHFAQQAVRIALAEASGG